MALKLLEHKAPLKASEMEMVNISNVLGLKGNAEMMLPKKYAGTTIRNKDHIIPTTFARALFAFMGSRNRNGGSDGLWMWGPSGVGKSTTLQQFAAGMRINSIATTCSREMEVLDLFGGYQLINGTQTFVPGPLVLAFLQPTWMILDEGGRLLPHVLGALRPVLEGKPFLIPGTNIMLNPHPESVLFVTDNTPDGIDRSGAFSGAVKQNMATRDAFQTQYVDHHSPADEFKIIRKATPKNLPSETIKNMIAFANDIRQQFKDGGQGSISADFTMRSVLQWAGLVTQWSPLDGEAWERVINALKQSYALALPPSECESIVTLAETRFKPGK